MEPTAESKEVILEGRSFAPVPEHVDETLDAPLPECCPRCRAHPAGLGRARGAKAGP